MNSLLSAETCYLIKAAAEPEYIITAARVGESSQICITEVRQEPSDYYFLYRGHNNTGKALEEVQICCEKAKRRDCKKKSEIIYLDK